MAAEPSSASGESDARPPRDYGSVYTYSKAGMAGVDREKVKEVVLQMARGSDHYKNEQRKAGMVDVRIARLRQASAALSARELEASQHAVDEEIAQLEALRDLTRTWLHVDMDAFFAAVEARDNPTLADRPFAVGGMSMISTANYVARRFGVRSAMPGFIAVKLCPELVFIQPNFDKYAAASADARRVFAEYDPAFSSWSMDEASLDATEHCRRTGQSGAEVAQAIRDKIRAQTRLTCSVGVAPNRTLAKICSDMNKPDGQFVVPPARRAVLDFASGMSVRKVPGIGGVTERLLEAVGVHSCGDILEHRARLARLFSRTSLAHFLSAALGLGRTRHDPPLPEGAVGRKGLSVERTFRAMADAGAQEAKCLELSQKLAAELQQEGLRGRTLTLKLKTSAFELKTRAQTQDGPLQGEEEIFAAALKLLRAEPCQSLRLMGLRMSGFAEEPARSPGQRSLEQILRRVASGEGEGGGGRDEGSCGGGGRDEGSGGGGGRDEGSGGGSEGGGEGDDDLELTLREWAPRPEAGGEDAASREGGAAAAGSADRAWACVRCTFENPQSRFICGMCDSFRKGGGSGTDRPDARTEKKRRRGTMHAFLASKTSS